MRKIFIPLLLVVMLSLGVCAWGAARTVSGNDVTITIDETGGTGIFSVAETLQGLSVVSKPATCDLDAAGKVLTCDSDDSGNRVLVYKTIGKGTVTGKISGGYPSTTKVVTGAASVPVAGNAPKVCTAADWVVGSWSECVGGVQTRSVTKKTDCTGETGKPEASQTCVIAPAGDQYTVNAGTAEKKALLEKILAALDLPELGQRISAIAQALKNFWS